MRIRLVSRSALLIVASIGALASAASCGARTGLAAPDPVAGDGGSGGTAVVACVPGTITLVKAEPAVMFVIDRSGSMGGHLGTKNGQGSRWSILTSALSATLPPVDGSMEVGALFFPSGGQSAGDLSCAVVGVPALLPQKGHVGAFLDLMNTTSPGGATPTATAIDVAATALASIRAATTARAMVLATDGGPNCNATLDASACRCAGMGPSCQGKPWMCLDDARTVERIGAHFAAGIPTYVIGIQDEGDTQFSDVLDAMADAGGRPKAGTDHYYAARSEAELGSALTAIRDQVGSCTYLTTSVPDTKGSITVSVGGAVVAFDSTGIEGWTWGNKGNGEIVFVGSACAAVTATPSETLTAQVACGGV